MEILNPQISEYLFSLQPERSAQLRRAEEFAREHNFPIVGPLVGAFLAQLALFSGARRVMELGSGFGYSALWFAAVLPPDGKIICTDHKVENREMALTLFREAGFESKIEFLVGNALELFRKVEGDFDIIFVDIDKHEYPETYRLALPKVRKGGILAFDNALWSGKIIEGDQSESTRGVKDVNRMAFADSSCIAGIIPLRDGVLVCVKK